jgi:hypothetical protein
VKGAIGKKLLGDHHYALLTESKKAATVLFPLAVAPPLVGQIPKTNLLRRSFLPKLKVTLIFGPIGRGCEIIDLKGRGMLLFSILCSYSEDNSE